MSKKHLTDEEIKGLLDGTKKKSQDFVYFSLGERVFFEFPKNSEHANSYRESLKPPYIIGQIVNVDNIKNGIVTVKSLEQCDFLPINSTKEMSINDLTQFSEEAEKGINDMVNLDKLNNATLLYNLKSRYNKNPREIYTYVTPSLLVINPYKAVPHLMTPEIFTECQTYINETKERLSHETIPHTFTIAAKALRSLYNEKIRQAIVISGESGAGKTETAKIAMGFLAKCSENSLAGSSNIEKKIVACSPVLEAFGNANTAKNHNSSRFGKYVKILFNTAEKKILGAYSKPYLLEKSRVVKLTSVDRNYHIFYHLLKGGPLDLLNQLYLLDENGNRLSKDFFVYLRDGCENNPKKNIDDVSLFGSLSTMLTEELGFSLDEQFIIFRIVAAVLYIGNLSIDSKPYDDSKNAPCEISNKVALGRAAALLGCAPEDLQREIVFRGAVMDCPRTACRIVECSAQRDSLAKSIYNSLFVWLVSKINEKTMPNQSLDEKNPNIKTIGLLDIYGFECLLHNDFEQLLINYTNEKLQKLYLNAIFETEKVVFKDEGLEGLLAELSYTDKTTPVIELLDNRTLSKPQGIFCRVEDYKKNDDVTNFLGTMTADLKTSPIYQRQKDLYKFMVRHTAKDVIYSARDFIEKNLDKINDDMKSFMVNKFEPEISNIIKVFFGEGKEKKIDMGISNGNTIWKKFSAQIKDLMEELGENPKNIDPCQIHFIRCIKPNEISSPDKFIDALVLQQIGYMGVLDSIKVRKMNYPNRISYLKFYERYEDLCSVSMNTSLRELQAQNTDFSMLTEKIMKEQFGILGSDLYAFGKTKFFMKNEVLSILEEARSRAIFDKEDACSTIRDAYFQYISRRKHERKLKLIVKLQQKIRKRYALKKFWDSLTLCRKIENAVAEYRTDKRKNIEIAAVEKIANAFDAQKVQKIVYTGLWARNLLMDKLVKASGMRKMEKVVYSINTAYDIFENAWDWIVQKEHKKAARKLIRLTKGFIVRQNFQKQIAFARQIGEKIRTENSVLLLQRKIKGLIIRNRLQILVNAVNKIKSVWKGWKFRYIYLKMQAAIKRIKRWYKNHYVWRKEIKDQWEIFLKHVDGQKQALVALENCHLFGAKNPQLPKELEKQFGTLPFDLFNSLVYYSKMETPEFLAHIKPVSPFGAEKISFFNLVCDLQLHCDTSDIYKYSWAEHWSNCVSDMLDIESPILSVSMGTTHTIAVNAKSQIFTWGCNEHGQCGCCPENEGFIPYSWKNKFTLPGTTARIKSIATGHYHTLVLDYDGNVFTWGNNEKGQLGNMKYEDVRLPIKMIYGLPPGEVKEIDACGDISVAVTKYGEAYMWPVYDHSHQLLACPTRIKMLESVKIESASCGDNFIMLLTDQGLVYSFGQASSEGQLGHGDLEPRTAPELIKCLKEAGVRMQTISCGYKHTIAKCSLGKTYTWGYGGFGQLGHGSFVSELSPRMLDLTDDNQREGPKRRAIQIAAGYSHTVVLCENRQLLWFGTSGKLQKQATPTKIPLETLFPQLFANRNILPSGAVTTTAGVALANTMSFFSPIKVMVSWSRTASVTIVTALDMRAMGSNIATSSTTTVSVVKSNSTVVNLKSQLNAMAAKWSPKETEPPFIETIAGIFSANVMKKSKSGAEKKIRPITTASQSEKILKTRNSLNKGIDYDLTIKSEQLAKKLTEIEDLLKNALSKDPASLTEREKKIIEHVFKKLSK